MNFKIFIFAAILSCLTAHVQAQTLPAVELSANDRVLILAPHPDDEVLGCAGIIQKAVSKGLPVRIAFFTYGDNNEWAFAVYRKHPVFMPKAVRKMGLIRHDEAIAAAKELGLSPGDLVFLGYPDFGTFDIWSKHWGSVRPYKSMLTEVNNVPYPNALRPGAPYKGEEILKDLEAVLKEFKPTKIFISHPADHNGDHRSLYLFTTVALWNMEKELKPVICPYLIHAVNWPKPRGYYPDEMLSPPAFLENQVSWDEYILNKDELLGKDRAIKAHHSEYISSEEYLLSFIRHNELFGNLPLMAAAPDLPDGASSEHSEMPEELIETEKAAFVGVEERYIRPEDGSLVFSISFSRPLPKSAAVSAYFFGYRDDVPFGDMPKIRVEIGALGCKSYDQDRRLPSKSIKAVRSAEEITLYVPLQVLRYPQRIMTNAGSYLAEVPLDLGVWRILEINDRSVDR